ncbi:hypothetical protein [Streptomyces sp. NPDC023327]|uniref:hypothetical protein n=1 Tax=Streptomyces sp. NPDC023327 TaxID=3157088 RepID=UPI0033D0CBE3
MAVHSTAGQHLAALRPTDVHPAPVRMPLPPRIAARHIDVRPAPARHVAPEDGGEAYGGVRDRREGDGSAPKGGVTGGGTGSGLRKLRGRDADGMTGREARGTQ